MTTWEVNQTQLVIRTEQKILNITGKIKTCLELQSYKKRGLTHEVCALEKFDLFFFFPIDFKSNGELVN